MTLKYKLTANLVAASLVPVIFVAAIAYGNAKHSAVNATLSNLEAVSDATVERLERYRRQGGDESKLWSVVRDNAALGERGEILVARRQTATALGAAPEIEFLAASRHEGDASELSILAGRESEVAIERALRGENGRSATYTDLAGRPVFAVTRYVADAGVGISVQMPKTEVYSSLSSLRFALIVMAAIVLGFCVLMAYITALSVAVPVQNLTLASTQIAGGALDTPIEQVPGDDEISALSHAFSTMTAHLRELYEGLESKVRQRTHQLEDALKEVTKFQQAVQYSTDSVFITDREMRIIYINPALEKLSGYRAWELLGKTVDVFKYERNDPALYLELFAVAARGQGVESDELINVRKDGSEYNAEFTFYPIKQRNQIQFFVGIINDITQRKREERAKSEFVSLASHQLRTPLTSIRWGMGRLRKTFDQSTLSPQQTKLFDAAHHAAKQMADTIGTMLMISRLSSGKLKLMPQSTDVAVLLQAMNELYQAQCVLEQKQMLIECPAPCAIQSDPALLKEVLSNIISNAIKYSPAGQSVRVNVTQHGNGVTVAVSDQGCGIPAAEQGKVFSMFFRAENAQRMPVSGTGLGLYLVYSLVTFLGGSISFTSEENRGTTFSIFLPLTPPQNG